MTIKLTVGGMYRCKQCLVMFARNNEYTGCSLKSNDMFLIVKHYMHEHVENMIVIEALSGLNLGILRFYESTIWSDIEEVNVETK